MINIYLCDDDQNQLDSWKEIINNYLSFEKLNQQIVCSSQTPDGLLNKLDLYPNTMGLYFLDIGLQADCNGLQLAAAIRSRDPLGEIVFITSKSEMCYLTYEYQVRALDFIIKDNPSALPDKIRKCMRAAAEKEKQINALSLEPLYLKINGERVYLNTEDVLYIKTSKEAIHKIIIYTKTGFESIYSTLKEMELALKKYPSFCRCNKSIIVNKKYIERTTNKGKELLLTNGTVLPVSLRCLKNIENK